MSHQVFLTDEGAFDLEELYDYIEAYDTLEKANWPYPINGGWHSLNL